MPAQIIQRFANALVARHRHQRPDCHGNRSKPTWFVVRRHGGELFGIRLYVVQPPVDQALRHAIKNRPKRRIEWFVV